MRINGLAMIAKAFGVGMSTVHAWRDEGAPIVVERQGSTRVAHAEEDALKAWVEAHRNSDPDAEYVGPDIAKRLYPDQPEQALLAAIFMTYADLKKRFRGSAPAKNVQAEPSPYRSRRPKSRRGRPRRYPPC